MKPSDEKGISRKKSRLRPWIIVCAFMIVLVGGCFGNMLREDTAIPAQDLEFGDPPSVPAEKNAVVALSSLAPTIQVGRVDSDELINFLTGDQVPEFYESTDDMGTAQDVEVFVAANEVLIDGVEQALELEGWQTPSVADESDFLLELMAVAKALRIHALWAARHGQLDRAIELNALERELGRRCSRGSGAWIDFMIGTAVESRSYGDLRLMAFQPGWTRAASERVVRLLTEESALSWQHVVGATRCEVRYYASIEEYEDLDFEMAIEWSGFEPSWMPRSLIWKPVRTRNKYVKMVRGFLVEEPQTFDAFRLRFHEAGYLEAEVAPHDDDETSVDLVALLGGNALGDLLLRGVPERMRDIVWRYFALDGARNQLRLWLALRRHEVDIGELPDSLDELVPGFIDAVPRDSIDGRPMRYSKEQRCVYRLGFNYSDDGGDPESDDDIWFLDTSRDSLDAGESPRPSR